MCRILVFFLVVGCAGCAGDRHARQLTLDTIQTMVKYEAAVDKKVSAEKTFYCEQQSRIRTALVGKPPIIDLDKDKVQVQKTLIYAQIRTSAERDARLTAEGIISSNPPKIMGSVIDFIVRGVKEDQAFYLNIVERQRRLAESLLTDLEKIDQQKERLKNVRNGLATLATQPDVLAQMKQIYEFEKAVEKEMADDTNTK